MFSLVVLIKKMFLTVDQHILLAILTVLPRSSRDGGMAHKDFIRPLSRLKGKLLSAVSVKQENKRRPKFRTGKGRKVSRGKGTM